MPFHLKAFGSSLFTHGYPPDQYLGFDVFQCSVLLEILLVSLTVEIVLWIGSWQVKSFPIGPYGFWVCVRFLNEKCRSLGVSPDIMSCEIRLWPHFHLRQHRQDLEANHTLEHCWNQNMAAFRWEEHLGVPILRLNVRIFVHATLRLQMCVCQNWETENEIIMVTSVLHCSACSAGQCMGWRLISYAKPLVGSVIKPLNFSLWGGSGRRWGEHWAKTGSLPIWILLYDSRQAISWPTPQVLYKLEAVIEAFSQFSLVHRRWGQDSSEVKSPKKVEPPSS